MNAMSQPGQAKPSTQLHAATGFMSATFTEFLDTGGAAERVFSLYSAMISAGADPGLLSEPARYVLYGLQREISSLPARMAELASARNLSPSRLACMAEADWRTAGHAGIGEPAIQLDAHISARGKLVMSWKPLEGDDFNDYSDALVYDDVRVNDIVGLSGFEAILGSCTRDADGHEHAWTGGLPSHVEDLVRAHLAVAAVSLFHDVRRALECCYEVSSTSPVIELDSVGHLGTFEVGTRPVHAPMMGG